MIRVVHYMRRIEAYGIEGLYCDIRAHMPSDIKVTTCTSRFASRGFWPRIYDILRARRWQGDVNHITGDVHFLTYLLSKRRTVLTIHDCGTLQNARGLRRFFLWLLWYWLPEKRCATIVVVSEATKRELLRNLGCPEDKVTVIHNHVSDEFRPVPKPFDDVAPTLLLVGTTPNKNIERVADALADLACKVVIIGRLSHSQLASLQKNNIAYDNHYGLSPAAVIEQYCRCDVLVFASTYEGFGLPIVEAQAVGRAVVTSNVTSMPEVAGNAACLVDPFAVNSIRAGVRQVIEQPEYRGHLVKLGFENVKRFQIKEVAARYASLYRRIYRSSSRIASAEG